MKIDLSIRVKPADVENTGFQTTYEQYEHITIPIGLCNVPATLKQGRNENSFSKRFYCIHR